MSLENMMAKYSPSLASYQMGEDRALKQLQERERLLQMQLQNQQTSAMNPLNQQFRQAEVDSTLQDVHAKKSANEINDYLKPHKIAASISEMSTKIGADGMNRLAQDGERMNMVATMLRKVPPMARAMILQDTMKKYSMDAANNPFLNQVMNMNPEDIPDAIESMGKGMALASKNYIQQQALASSAQANQRTIADNENATRLAVTDKNNATQIKVAEITAAARKEIAANRIQATKHMTMDQAIAYLTMLPERGPEEDAKLKELQRMKLEQRAAGANPLPAEVMGKDSPQALAAQYGKTPQPQANNAPAGYKLIGTSNGKPVYEGPDGKRYIGK